MAARAGHRIASMARALARQARERPWLALEAAAALGAASLLLAQEGLRAVWLAIFRALSQGAGAAISLLAGDTGGTLIEAAATLLKVALVVAPSARLFARTRRHRLAYLPLWAVFFVLSLPMLFPAIATPAMWTILIASAAGGWLSAGRPRLRPLALAPLLVAYEPVLSHSPLGDRVWTPARLAPRCADNDGARPRGSSLEMAATRYYGVTAFGPDLLLLTGDRHSFWIRRAPDGAFAIEQPSRALGNLWQGCTWGPSAWLTKRGKLFRVTPAAPGSGSVERIDEIDLPDPPGLLELDFADAVCDPARGMVYATEVMLGGIRALPVDDRLFDQGQDASPVRASFERTQITDGFNIQILRRDDGMFIGIDTARLFVYDPAARRTIEEHPVGISALGIDLCHADGAVVIADLAGRLRLFARDAGGAYSFERGVTLAAPRRVAFSPDCNIIAVTSGNDRTVTILHRADLSITAVYSLGPGLRDLMFSGPHEVAVADACGLTTLRLPEGS